jgi:tRNA A-37 threonylcarbamoyl transferase component Bud32
MKLTPFEAFQKTTNKLYILIDGTRKYLVKSYCGPNSFTRYRQEKFMIDHWRQAGFKVPQVYDKQVPDIPEPYLVTSFIEGSSLREYLSTNNTMLPEKLALLAKFFEQMQRRHHIAIQSNDKYLVHYDPSSGNIVCTENDFCFIDFETKPKKSRSVLEAASIELATTSRWIVRDLGIDSIEHVLKLMVESYANQHAILNLIVRRTAGRPFQLFHRWKNKKRKLARPGEITKYDIADTLAKLQRSSHLENAG